MMRRWIAALMTLAMLLAACVPALAELDLTHTRESTLFRIDEGAGGEYAFVSLALDITEMGFTHRYALSDQPSFAYSDLLINRYGTADAYAVWRLWFEYKATQSLNIHAVTILLDGKSYTFSDLSGLVNNEEHDDYILETPCIVFGSQNTEFWLDYLIKCETLENKVEILNGWNLPVILHGDEDVEITVNGATLFSLFAVGEEMANISGIASIIEREGTPVEVVGPEEAATGEAAPAVEEVPAAPEDPLSWLYDGEAQPAAEEPAVEEAVPEDAIEETFAEEPAADADPFAAAVAGAVEEAVGAVEEAVEEAAEAAEEVPAGPLSGKTVILHSNDVHGAIEGYAYIAAQKKAFEEQGARVFTVDAGDFSQGTVYVSASKGLTAIEMMNKAGYDLATLGNHEFDFGYAQLMDNLNKAEFPVICADVVNIATGETILPATAILESDGLKIGFFGMETPETATKVNPGLITEINFKTFDDLYTSAQTAIDTIRDSADLVIGLVHLGVDNESAANGYRSVDMLNKVTGVDFLIDGHSHTVMTEGEKGEPIQSTGTAFNYIGVIVIDNETKAIEDHYLLKTRPLAEDEVLPENVKIVVPEEELPKDEEVLAAARAIIDEVDAQYSTPFAVTEVLLNGDRAPGNRTEETNLGDLITDAMVWYVARDGGIENAEPNQIVGITNGGGIRAPIAVGEVTKKDINTVLPFGNTVAVIYVTGEELLEALEASTFATPEAIGGFPQTSGIVWSINTAVPFDQGELYIVGGKETTYYAPASIRRVTIESVNGVPFDPAAVYAVVTNNFCAAGGDTYAVFYRAYEEGSGFDTGIPMDEAVMAYIEEVLGGKITAEKYGEPAVRLTILP